MKHFRRKSIEDSIQHSTNRMSVSQKFREMCTVISRKPFVVAFYVLLILYILWLNLPFPDVITVPKVPKNRFPLPIQKYKQERCSNSVRNATASKQEILGRLSRNPRIICNCTGFRQNSIDKNSYAESKCSDEATLAGGNQHVITFSFYSKPESVRATKKNYFDGILANLKSMNKIYPGWIMRVYTNVSYSPEVCEVVCADEKLYFCDVRGLHRFAEVESIDPMLWRSMPMGDPTVKEFAVRDLDSRLSQREKDAVDQWEESGYPIHGIRDHPMHLTEVMGGMWGADNYKLCLNVGREIQFQMMERAWKRLGFDDQQILYRVVYKRHRNKILTHDSYTCEVYKDSIPFPTMRPQSRDYVQRVEVNGSDPAALKKRCPVACRPIYGQNWDYC